MILNHTRHGKKTPLQNQLLPGDQLVQTARTALLESFGLENKFIDSFKNNYICSA